MSPRSLPVVEAGRMIFWEDVRSGPAVILASAFPSPQTRLSLDKTSGSGGDEQPFPKAQAVSSLMRSFLWETHPPNAKGPRTS